MKKRYMKNRLLICFLALFLIIPGGVLIAEEINLKLPFEGGQSWLVTRAYNVASHQDYGGTYSDDRFALDFVLGGCASYGLAHLSVADGVVRKVTRSNIGYGNTVLVEHVNGIFSRYAHLSQIVVNVGDPVVQGQILGKEGNTGNVFGTACPEHPGTHLHFAMYQNGSAYKPEPMSNYTNFVAWGRYNSDNLVVGTVPNSDPGTFPIFDPGTTPGISGYSFGGLVTNVSDCSCSGNSVLTINNLSTGGPNPIYLLYQPGVSQVYENNKIPVTGVWLNGNWANTGDSCVVPETVSCGEDGLDFCTTCTGNQYSDGTITITGTSN